jgi:DNA-binding MarR family transcriptional regulator
MKKQALLMDELTDLVNELVNINKPELEMELKGYSFNELEIIEHIEKIAYPNVTKLARASYMTKGAISKLVKKLEDKDIVEIYQDKDNKKEKYIRLTKKGKVIYHKHQGLHDKWLERDQEVFVDMSDDDYDVIFSFIGKYRHHLKK